MTLGRLRAAVLILGSVAAGWSATLVIELAMPPLGQPGGLIATADTRHAVTVLVANLVGALVSGVVLGMVADGRSAGLWLVSFFATWTLWPLILTSHHPSGSHEWSAAAMTLMGVAFYGFIAAATFWLVRRLRGRRLVA
jgi:hypothetical protein